MENSVKAKSVNRLLSRIAWICGAFGFIFCILIMANYIQLKRVDPLNTPAMTILQNKLKNDLSSDSLRTEIREMDLLSRKAFFTSQWQIRTGGYFLLVSTAIVIICLQWIELRRPKIPAQPQPDKVNVWTQRKITRRWILYTGIVLVAGSLILAWLTYRELGEMLNSQQPDLENPADASLPQATNGKLNQLPGQSIPPDSAGRTADTGENSKQTYLSPREILDNCLTFRGPYGNGVITQKNFPVSWNGSTGNGIAWKTGLPLPGCNSPVVWKDRVFLSGANAIKREIWCFDAGTGKILWKAGVSDIAGTPGTVPKVDPQTGFAASTLTCDGQRIYAIFATGDLIALSIGGNRIWAKNLGLPKNHYGHASSLMMYRNLLIVQLDQQTGSGVMAFNGETGEQVWKTNRNVHISWSSPILVHSGNLTELILVADPVVSSYDPATGKERWRVDCISGEVGPSAACTDGIVFTVNEYAKLAAIKLGETPHLMWESTDYLSDIPSPVAGNNCLFLATSYGTFVCYDAATGKENWIKELNNPLYASPMLVDGKIYQLDKSGFMHIFKADPAGDPVAESPLGENAVATPAFSGGKIYIRGEKNLYCIGK